MNKKRVLPTKSVDQNTQRIQGSQKRGSDATHADLQPLLSDRMESTVRPQKQKLSVTGNQKPDTPGDESILILSEPE